MKLWQKSNLTEQSVETFTVGNDRDFDAILAPYDILGNIAHAKMLGTIHLLQPNEVTTLCNHLKYIYQQTVNKNFKLPEDVEDVHSYVELQLTSALGDMGKKIHAARSRNDQVLVDIKLFLRAEIEQLTTAILELFKILQEKSEQHKNDLLPGYTHMQMAMPSSFGLWFGSYAESLVDDVITLKGAYDIVNKNPLGSAAGYGASFPINRTLTTELLGFANLNYNVVYAQMGRGKVERITAQALSNVADTLGRMSMDLCLYLNPNFGFISFPDKLTTGSSIMPHKKNPDVLELIRGYCNQIKAIPNEIQLCTTNLPSGYHRDYQLLKSQLFPAFVTINNCIKMSITMLKNITIKANILKQDKYQYLFSVETVNELVLQGIPFRDAYKKIAIDIENNNFNPTRNINHTHEGSIGNLCTTAIKKMMEDIIQTFPFDIVNKRLNSLLQ
jgi:argininosuccinate lyase